MYGLYVYVNIEMTDWETSMHKLHEAVGTRDLSALSPTSSNSAPLHNTKHLERLRLWLPALDPAPPRATTIPVEMTKAEATVLSMDRAASSVVEEGFIVEASYDEEQDLLDTPPGWCFADMYVYTYIFAWMLRYIDKNMTCLYEYVYVHICIYIYMLFVNGCMDV